jgi:hypothetical protein
LGPPALASLTVGARLEKPLSKVFCFESVGSL